VDSDCASYPRAPFSNDAPNTTLSGSKPLASDGAPFAVDTHALPRSSESPSVDLPESEITPMWAPTVLFTLNGHFNINFKAPHLGAQFEPLDFPTDIRTLFNQTRLYNNLPNSKMMNSKFPSTTKHLSYPLFIPLPQPTH